mmetsp:Transcript_80488/g.193027  ORF Transcript_80488/g.193027 Transcript_80488/m.193027 type:complete len:231 (+) Transcript_80488:3303-3995(+)
MASGTSLTDSAKNVVAHHRPKDIKRYLVGGHQRNCVCPHVWMDGVVGGGVACSLRDALFGFGDARQLGIKDLTCSFGSASNGCLHCNVSQVLHLLGHSRRLLHFRTVAGLERAAHALDQLGVTCAPSEDKEPIEGHGEVALRGFRQGRRDQAMLTHGEQHLLWLLSLSLDGVDRKWNFSNKHLEASDRSLLKVSTAHALHNGRSGDGMAIAQVPLGHDRRHPEKISPEFA